MLRSVCGRVSSIAILKPRWALQWPQRIRAGDIEVVAEAIYEAHRKPPTPNWANASAAVKAWVRVQAAARRSPSWSRAVSVLMRRSRVLLARNIARSRHAVVPAMPQCVAAYWPSTTQHLTHSEHVRRAIDAYLTKVANQLNKKQLPRE
jgi:hypothetical protein